MTSFSVFGQAKINEDTTKAAATDKDLMQVKDTTYGNQAAGELTPGKGFQLVKSSFASMNLSMYAMVRYLNQIPGEGTQTWYDHLGNPQQAVGRNDFFWHRTMLWFTGHVASPKLTYMCAAWTIMTTQQTLIYGNLKYSFNDRFMLGMGVVPNACIRTLQGPFPFFSSTDRTMAEDALRGGFTSGLFLAGMAVPKVYYNLVLGNNLSSIGITANKLTRNLATSGSVWWMPTTGEFGPRGGNGDFEDHQKVATRFGASYVHSRENRYNNIGQPSPDNTQVRMSDGVLFYQAGALAPNVTVQEADFDLCSVDLGFKYKGFALHTEFYYRTLSNFDADGPTPISKITDKGYSVSILYMVIPKTLCVYGVNSMLIDEFNRNPYEVGGGVNIYPEMTRSWRINVQGLHVYKTAAGGTFGLYTAGLTGPVLTVGIDVLL